MQFQLQYIARELFAEVKQQGKIQLDDYDYDAMDFTLAKAKEAADELVKEGFFKKIADKTNTAYAGTEILHEYTSYDHYLHATRVARQKAQEENERLKELEHSQVELKKGQASLMDMQYDMTASHDELKQKIKAMTEWIAAGTIIAALAATVATVYYLIQLAK